MTENDLKVLAEAMINIQYVVGGYIPYFTMEFEDSIAAVQWDTESSTYMVKRVIPK